MKKIFLLLMLLLFLPTTIYADEYYADIYVKTNGDIEVHEATVKDGTYNGIERQILLNYDEEDKIFSSNIALVRICESDKDNPLVNIGKCFIKASDAKEGSNFVYTEKEDNDKVIFNLYNTNENRSAFYMEYIFKDAFVGYDDLNEALITLFTKDNKEKFSNVEIKVHYPEKSSEYKTLIDGLNWLKEDKQESVTLYKGKDYSNIADLNMRIITPKDAVTTSKSKNGNREADLIKIESELKTRRKAAEGLATGKKVIHYTYLVIGAIGATLYVIGLGILIFRHYLIACKKRVKPENDYLTSFPSNDSPAAIEYLFNHEVSINSFKGSILYIIYKKGLLINVLDDDFVLTLNDEDLVEPLTESEISLRDFLLNNYGNGLAFKLYDINKIIKSEDGKKIFNNYFTSWQYKEIDSKVKKRFFENSGLSIYTIIYCIIPFALGLLGFLNKPLFSIMLLCFFSLPVFIYLCFSIKRTKEGNELYYQWRSLRLFMEDLVSYQGRLPESKTWGKYLAYASIFNESKIVANNMIEKIGNSYLSVYGIDASDYLLLFDMLDNIFKIK